jgi:hypothetical protein
MAEAFGLAVNVTAVVDLLVKEGVQCSLYCSGVKSAPRDVKYILDEASRLSKTLRDVDRLLKGPKAMKSTPRRISVGLWKIVGGS